MGEAPGTPEPGGWVGQDSSAVSWASRPTSMDARINADSLQMLRARVRGCAEASGLADRVEDVVLALHELAANVVRHGGGTGRLRAWSLPGMLRFQVDDGRQPPLDATCAPNGRSADGRASTAVLPFIPGHGLWVVERICDYMVSLSGPGGTSVAVAFDRPKA
jgi:anti-sigma regulatory factor (Ser/Thr protein kinase)